MLRGREQAEIDSAVDSIERALDWFRDELARSSGEDRDALIRKIHRVEGLLDLMRIASSILRLFVTTGRLDASALAGLRLGKGPSPEDS